MKVKIKQGSLFILIVLFVFTLTQGATREETIDRTLAIDGTKPVDFEFRENDGDVQFTAWDRDEVHIFIRKEIKTLNGRRTERLLEDTRVEISQRGNSIRVRIRYPRIKGFFIITDNYRVKVTSEIKIPANTHLDCQSDDGDIAVEGIRGELFLRADDGTIRIFDSSGSVEGGTDDGRFNLEDFSGEAKIDSDDGDLFLSGVFSKLDLSTDDGDIRIKNLDVADNLEDWEIETDDGDVDISFTSDFSAELFISTDDGNIDSLLPIVFKEIASKQKLSGKINEGGKLITIRTDDGDITLRETKF